MLLANYESTNISTTVTLTSTGANQQLAQGIKARRVASIGMVYVYLALTGAPGGYLYVDILDSSHVTVTNGVSNAIPSASITAGWNVFYYDRDARPSLAASTLYYISIKHSGYTADASNYVAWSCDQSSPHYILGVGEQYSGAAWAAISTVTDFVFRVYSGYRTTIYSRIDEIEPMIKELTTAGVLDTSSTVTARAVMDFEELVADKIDGWLIGAGITAPLTETVAQSIVRPYANQCTALECLMTQNTSGFTTESGRTKAGTFNLMCDILRKDLASKGTITDALLESEDDIEFGGSDGLTAGMVEADDRDDRDEDDDLIQPMFKGHMWDT